jgi:cell division protein FtsL
MASSVAPKRAGKKGGRSVFVMLLIGFLLVATGVIARRTFGIGQARDIRARETQRDALEATRVQLEVDIRDASSRARLGPVAERRLNMRVPSDSQVIILKREPKS